MTPHGQDRARELLAYAQRHSPFWRDVLGPVDPARAPWDSLPVVDRAAFVARLDDTFCDQRLSGSVLAEYLRGSTQRPLHGRYTVFHSAGATGTPLYLAYDPATWAAYGAAMVRAVEGIGASTSMSVCLLGSDDIRHTLPRLASLFPDACVVGLQDGVPEALRRLSEAAPTLLIGYSSALALVARAQLSGQLAIRPRFVLAGTDALSASDATTIESAWGTYPYSYYSTTEGGLIAAETAQRDGLHLDTESVAVAVTSGQLLVSQLTNQVQPVVRYRLPDAVRLADGRLLLTRGRSRSAVVVPAADGRGLTELHPIVLRSALDPLGERAWWDGADLVVSTRSARDACQAALIRAGASVVVRQRIGTDGDT